MAKTNVRTTAESRCFGGAVSFHEHPSQATGGEMRFSAYVPPQAESGPVPVLYFTWPGSHAPRRRFRSRPEPSATPPSTASC